MDQKTHQSELDNPLLDSLGIGLWEYDVEKDLIYISTTTQKIIAASSDELSWKEFLSMVYKEDQFATSRNLKQLANGGNSLDMEIRLNNPKPFHQWVNIQGNMLNTDPQKPVIIGRIQDTSRKTLTRQIQQSMRELLTDVIDHHQANHTLLRLCQAVNDIEPAIHCVIVLNKESGREQELLHAHSLPASLKTILRSITLTDEHSELFYTYEKRRALMISDLYRLVSWRSVEQLDIKDSYHCFTGQSIYCNDNTLQGAVCLYLPDDSLGEESLIEVVNELNNLATMIIEQQLQRDTKEKIQQQLNHSQKMDSLGHLTGGIAHDFNNILGSIIGYNSLSKKVAKELSSDKLIEYLGEVGIAAERARDLISQMMVFSRSEPTKQIVIDGQMVIKEVLQLIRSMIPTSIDISANYSSHCPKIKINPISLHQVLLNHLINAKDAIPDENGTIQVNMFPAFRVSQTCQSCHERFKGNYVAIQISDDGHGIPSEVISKIFNPFFTTKDVGRGTGMGLSVVHGILHDVNAHITVKSQVNKGTKITLYFPEADPEEASDSNITEPLIADSLENVGKGQHIMVIDDDVPLSLLFSEILESHGYEVSRYQYPQEALIKFKEDVDKFDLVITDQTMPRMTGDELALEILNINPDMPIIICTGYSEKITTPMIKKMGIRGILRKPVEIYTLLDAVDKSLKGIEI